MLHTFSRTLMWTWFFGKYPAMDMRPLPPECHGSEIIFDCSRNF